MRRLFQLFLILLALVLSYSQYIGGVIDYSLILLWVMAWFFGKDRAITYAIGLGFGLDLIGFLPFGFWMITNYLIINLVDYLKNSFLTESSMTQSLVVLMLACIITHLAVSIVVGEYNFTGWGISLIANVIVGAIIHYLLVIRMKMIQRWSGKVI